MYVIISGNGKRKALFQEEFWEKGITSWEPPFKVLFKSIDDGEFNFIYEGSSRWATGKWELWDR
ncbi:hypothetical protein DWY97_25710, partial [Bacteroides thetaiotaomicron]